MLYFICPLCKTAMGFGSYMTRGICMSCHKKGLTNPEIADAVNCTDDEWHPLDLNTPCRFVPSKTSWHGLHRPTGARANLLEKVVNYRGDVMMALDSSGYYVKDAKP